MLRVRWVNRIGTPGRISYWEPQELESKLRGADYKVYIDRKAVDTKGLIIPDGAKDVVVIEVPGAATAIAFGVFFAVVGVVTGVAELVNLAKKSKRAMALAQKFSNIDAPKPAASIRGSRNEYRANGRMPILFGNHMLVPDQAGVPFSSYKNNDQWYHQLFCLGYNNIEYTNPKIGDTAITNYESALSEGLEEYPRLVSEMMIGMDLQMGQPVIKTSPEKTVKINIGISFPTGLRRYDSNADPQTQTVRLKLGYRLKDGVWFYEEKEITENEDKVRRMYSFSVPAGQYEVSVEKLYPGGGGAKVRADSYLDVLQFEVESKGSTAPLSDEILNTCKISFTLYHILNEICNLFTSFICHRFYFFKQYIIS